MDKKQVQELVSAVWREVGNLDKYRNKLWCLVSEMAEGADYRRAKQIKPELKINVNDSLESIARLQGLLRDLDADLGKE